MMRGNIFLIPNTLGSDNWQSVLPADIVSSVETCRHFAVENVRTARRFLKKLNPEIIIDDLYFYVLDKHTPFREVEKMIQVILTGESMGIISEAGCPGIADPGSELVRLAHRNAIQVIPLVGPSSLFLALMASGLNGQSFVFHGYLPIPKGERQRALREIERSIEQSGSTHLFIEAPYRNNPLLEDILSICKPGLLLCIAKNITLPDEFIATKPISDWRKQKVDLHKQPSIFLLGR